ncbi:MAG TPA: ABC transporter substrate binding protein [Methylotenera sp.]|nr:ABC transporter substrate binding protein [Methylotenera sp.]
MLSNWHKKSYLMNKLACFALMLGLFAPFLAQAYNGVTIVISAPTAANQEFVKNFKDELVRLSAVNLRVKVIDLQDSEKLVVAENSELVIALGVKALGAASKLKLTTPVMGVFTPLPAFNSLLLTSRRDLGNFTAIVLDQPYFRQMALIKTVLPDTKSIGILLGPTSSQYNELLKDEAEKNTFSVSEENIYQESDLIPKLQKTLEATDALLAIPDPLVYSRETAQPILLTSYRHLKPVFGYSQSYVRAGALAAVYSKPSQLARQAAEITVSSQQAPSLLPPPQTPKYFSIIVNYQVGRSLNIPILDEDALYKRMLALEAIQK